MSYTTFTIEKRGAVDWLTLNRPDAFNTITPTMSGELQDYFRSLYTNHSVRVVVMRGAGKHFCAGLDLKDTNERNSQQGDEHSVTSGPAAGLRSQRRISGRRRPANSGRAEDPNPGSADRLVASFVEGERSSSALRRRPPKPSPRGRFHPSSAR